MSKKVQINTLEQLRELASKISSLVTPSDIIYLEGDLGAGKTTFCQTFFKLLGYDGMVKSPTYAMVEMYNISGQEFHHLNDPSELYHLGIDDYFSPQAIVLVEWPSKGVPVLPPATLTLRFSLSNDGERVVRIESKKKAFQVLLFP